MDMANLKVFAANFVTVLGNLITYAVFARVILSWFMVGGGSPGRITQFINDITDPILAVAKKFPHRIGMIDLSPLIALFGVNIIAYLLVELIASL
jgi:YggT family protein